MSKHSFMSQMEKAKRGERLVENYLNEKGWTVTDVSDNKEYQVIGVDFLTEKDGESRQIEVKLDTVINRTGNFFIEIVGYQEQGKPGWFETSEADYIFYIDAATDIAYVFKVEDMREYLQNNYAPRRNAFEKGWNGWGTKTSIGYCVNVKKYAALYNLLQIEL